MDVQANREMLRLILKALADLSAAQSLLIIRTFCLEELQDETVSKSLLVGLAMMENAERIQAFCNANFQEGQE